MYAAASQTNKRLNDKVRERMGVASTSYVREQRINKRLAKKSYNATYRKSKKYKARRKAKKLIKASEVVKSSKNPARHKSEKLSAKEDVKAAAGGAKKKASGQRKRKTPCPNCKRFHPGKCPEPNYSCKRVAKSKLNKEDIASLF